jgi:putative ABC transport system permease protein
MSFFSAIRVALAALLVNKGRSGLTSLGIVIGISAVIAMVSAGDGARAMLDERLESVGKNLILIRAGARTQQGMVADFTPLTGEDAEAIQKQVGHLLVGVAKLQFTQRVATTGVNTWPTGIVGGDPEVLKVRKWKLTAGQFFTDDDVKKRARVCLIGETVRKKLFPDRPNPVGQTIRVDHRLQLHVIGVLAEKGRSPIGADQDDQIFIPLTTLQERLVGGGDKLSMILTAVRDERMIDKAKEEIIRVLREKHRVKAGHDKFDVSSVHEMAELAVLVTRVLQLLVAVIASISLVVGGIGIMNIMLVSVTERTREIGIRMAVGATPGDILTQFLIEAVVLAMVGGVIGITLGIAGAVGIARVAGWEVVISPVIVVVACAVAAAVGVFFGFYPAQKASRLDPIEALRYE